MISYMNDKSYANHDTLAYLPLKTKKLWTKTAIKVDNFYVLIKLYTIIIVLVYWFYLASSPAQFNLFSR